jgi:TolB protein
VSYIRSNVVGAIATWAVLGALIGGGSGVGQPRRESEQPQAFCDQRASRYGEIGPTWAPDGSAVAFVSTLCGTRQLFRIDSDGTDAVRLTHRDGGFDSEPSWSPDGDRIAFISDRGETLSIYVMRPDGSDVRRLTDDLGNDYGHPAWSPDGTRLLFASDRAFPEARVERLADGRMRVDAASTELFVVDIADGTIERVTANLTQDSHHQGAWLDHDRIVFSSASAAGKDIFVGTFGPPGDASATVPSISADAMTRLTFDGLSDYATVTSDRRWIVYLTRRDGDATEIYRMTPTGESNVRLTHSPGYDQDPAWSHDGRRIAFSSQRSGVTRLYVMDADGGNVSRLTPEM